MPRRQTDRRYLQLDVFAERPGAGNALGVMFDASALDSESMQAFAAWNNLSETIFLLPPTTPAADYRVRIFTPRQELPFAGHPSVGAAWAAVEGGIASARGDALVQECAAGLLPVRVAGDESGLRVQVRAPRAHEKPAATQYRAQLDAALAGLPRGRQRPALWDNGPAWWLAELADGAAVRAMAPDLAAIADLTRASGAVGLAVYGRAHLADHHLVVRAYCPADNVPEDPVTGSANACIAAQLSASGTLPGTGGTYVASQGRELGRDGKVHVRIDADGDAWIGGQVQCVIDGHVAWPETSWSPE
ncbi:MAG: PhzF family phenazine biosynthesis protein [Luteimonas sp.]